MDERAAAWVVQAVGGSHLLRGRRLTGGLTSSVHAVDVQTSAGVERLVLRRWPGTPWPDGSIDDGERMVADETHVLTAIAGSGLPAPAVVATDPTGDEAGLPALLMTRLPGRLDLTPHDPLAWVQLLAEQLHRLHDVTPSAPLPSYESWVRLDPLEVPTWSSRPELWRDAIDLVAAPAEVPQIPLIHHDFQQFNVLWSGGRISGLVDWVAASQGPPDDDVMHCRLNLCLLYDADRAMAFQSSYEAIAGRTVHPWWDVVGVLDYLGGWTAEDLQRQAGRRLRIDGGGMNERIEQLLLAVMRRVTC
jgi:aminoglycoside phosphotransferase (APT) family kinase protein